ncbi:microperfuranone synthase [Physcia stellaris]|nr:microperfuranone synthase [Physcia stellaris]
MMTEEVADFNELLAWIVCAKRPLTLAELEFIMCIKAPDGRGLVDLEDLLRNRYAYFFTVLRENNLTIEDPQNKHAQWPELGDEDQESNDDNQIEIDVGSNDECSNVSVIESDPVTTVVHLAHASIGEFFRTNTPTIIADVGIDIHEAEVSILRTCLSLWCEENLWVTWKCCFAYAPAYWPKHLGEINISLVSAENKSAIGIALIRTMRDEKVLSRWVSDSKHREAWGHRDKYSSIVLKWFKDKDVTSDLSSDDREWTASLKSDVDVVHFIVLEAAGLWLKDNQWRWVPFFDSVWLHVERAIVEIARWAGFEENAAWYFKVGRILCSGMHFNEAIQYLDIALTRDPNLFWAWATLANCHAIKKDLHNAISCQLDGIQAFHADSENMRMAEANDFLTTVHSILGDWYLQLGDYDLALKSYKAVFDINPDFEDTTMSILYLMERRKQHAAIIDFLKELHAEIVPETDLPRLSGELEFIRESMVAAVKAARTSAKLGLLLFHLGLLTLRHFRDEPIAVRTWERVLRIPYASSAESDLGRARLIISRQLAMRYFDRAFKSGKDTVGCNAHIEKLQNLTKWATSLPHEAAEKLSYVYAPQDNTLV